ncbi:SDR family NAD(P)-dependent oxidoreductase [Microbacterium thalassium]|uniref:Short-subunit dehydrogenase n=1 Tax=Microbacterium thalassium TaxID=362649 RepID=A0A7X0KTW9_9MICO|nr:SDR family NAD(P)-dependent oxidoreductase [Microbacterium thalassium]MBB6390498.1 short-subunit dehydrogenase [Microbacterium thalassium]
MTRTRHPRAALVTGGSRGIGYAIAQRLAADGFALTLCARDRDRLESAAAALRAEHGVEVHVHAADLSDPEGYVDIVAAHAEARGSLDALVLNAGMGTVGPIADATGERLHKLMVVNAFSAIGLFRSALGMLRETAARNEEHGAKVIAVGSILGAHPHAQLGAYAASKAALVSLVKTLNLEHSGEGISSTAILPAYVATDMTTWLGDSVPRNTMLSAAEIAGVASMLAALSRRAVVDEIVIARAGTDGRIP